MPTQLQFRRGTTAQNNAFTGAAGEISIDSTIDTARVHDGTTAGGFELTQNTATQTLTNKTLTSAVLNTGVSGTAVLDEDDMSSDSATQLATQQSIKAYVDSQVTAQDLDVTSDSGTIAIDLDSETLTIAGGTGIDSSATSNTVTLAIDSTVTTLTGTQTLTNKTLTSPTINSATIAMGTNKITGMGDPINAQDAATKAYVDGELSSLSSNSLSEGNTTWVIADSGTGTITATVDGATHSTFAAAGITLSQGAFVGDVTGNADTATALATARTIGGVSFDGTANINLAGVNTAGNQDTSGNAATATALETARTIAGNSFDGTANITIASTQLSDSADLARLAAPAFTGTATGVNLTLSGDLTVNGTTTTLATTNTVISDNLIELNNGAGSNANDSGIVIERGSTGDNAFIGWDESADKFIVGTTTATGASTGNLTISSGTLVASTFEGALSGNATTASAWETARTLSLTGAVTGSASIDGSGNVSLATTNTADPVITLTGAVTGSGTMTNLGSVSITTTATADPTLTLAGDATGSATFTNLGNATLTVTVADDSHNHVTGNIDGLAEFISDTVGDMVTSNTESGISVTYDDTDNTLDFNVNDPTITLTGAVTGSATMTNLGNVSITTTATSDPTITLAGDLSGSATLTNLGSATLTATIAANSVALGTDTTGNYVGTITGGTGISSSGATSGEGVAHTLSVDLSELTDMTSAMVGTDEFIVLDAGADRRKAANEIGLSIFSNDAGFTTNTGDITGVTAGTGLSGGGSSGSVTLNVDLSELTDMTAAMTGTDEFIVLDAGADRRKAANEIGLSIFSNDAGFTTNTGDITNVSVSGTGLSGGGASGSVTITSNATSSNTGSTIVARDGSGNFSAGVITGTSTAARYADLAEKYTSDADYDPGTVLVFGGDEEVTECNTKYNKRIAGIVSTDPAYLMNSEGLGVTVALLGRVPCKVIGEIRKGDLMVSSDTPGHAQAWNDESNPPAGSVIGKALENKTGAGTDVIEVVVGRI